MGNNSNSNSNQIKEEVYTGQGGEKILTLSDIIISIYKININNIIQGTVFLIDSNKIGKGLMICYHVINFQALQNKESIKFYFEVQSKESDIDHEKRMRWIFADPDLDITFIELFEEDFNFEIYFLIYSLIDDYKNQHILIL